MPPDVSVLLPYRDTAATLSEALESVLAQEGPSLELVAVDDGSDDEGSTLVQEIARRDQRLVLVKTVKRGLVPALRTAVHTARGRWLARMDGDDVCLPGRLSMQVAMLEGDPSLGVIGTLVESFPLSAVGPGLRRYIDWQNSLLSPDEHDRDLFVESPLCHPSTMMRRTALEGVGGYQDVRWAEDYDLWLRFSAAGWKLAKVPRVLLRWRHRLDRLTLTDSRYEQDRFVAAKANYLAPRIRDRGLPLTVWGACPTGKRLARALEAHDVRATRVVDVDPRKIGGVARGVPIVAPDALEPGVDTIVVAVGARGARATIRAHLDEAGFRDGADYVCAA